LSVSDSLSKSRQVVAFTAKVTSTHNAHNPLVFSSVLTNIGAAYSPGTGKFTCPMDGTYVFASTITGYALISVQLYIMKNGQSQTDTFSQLSGAGYPSVSVHVVLSLRVGDEVWVKSGLPLFNNDLFSGFLLHAD
jgi:hypothetical protein